MAGETAGRRFAPTQVSTLSFAVVGVGVATTVFVKTFITSVTGKANILLPFLKCIQLKMD
jgi:hypothetical protein